MHKLLFASLFLLLAACGTDNAATATAEPSPAETATAPNVFAAADAALAEGAPVADVRQLLLADFPKVSDAQTGLPNPKNSKDFVKAAVALSDRNPADTLAADPLYKAAEVARGLNDSRQAADIYRKLYDRYPNYSKAPEALFMLAFTYDENLKDYDRARATYEEFLAKHPDHFFAKDAPLMIKNLGKTSEELLKELESQQEQ